MSPCNSDLCSLVVGALEIINRHSQICTLPLDCIRQVAESRNPWNGGREPGLNQHTCIRNVQNLLEPSKSKKITDLIMRVVPSGSETRYKYGWKTVFAKVMHRMTK